MGRNGEIIMLKRIKKAFIAMLAIFAMTTVFIAVAHARNPTTWMNARRPAPGGTIRVEAVMAACSTFGIGHRFSLRTTGPGNTSSGWRTVTVSSMFQNVHSHTLTVNTFAANVQFTGNFEVATPGSNVFRKVPNRTITVR